MKHSESLKNIAPAIRKAQAKISGVVPNQKNPFFKSEYADLEACWSAVKDALHAEGISLVQTMGFRDGAGPTLSTTLLHESGEYISGEQALCAKGDNPQEMGSAISYARRYGLSAMLSLVEKDDDGEGAMNRNKPTSGPKPLKAVSSADPGAATIPFKKSDAFGKRLDSLSDDEINKLAKWYADMDKKGEKPTGLAAAFRADLDAFIEFKYGVAK